ncbi:hypothetical protein ACS0TY_026025 [Phlomoides rotata]
MSSSRDNWERLVTAVVKRQQIWELCHQQSRTPSISTLTSDDLSQQILSFSGSNFDPFSVPPSPLLPPKIPSISKAFVNNQQSPERHKSQPLQNWKTRERIALGTARGLAHLHEGIRDKKIIHRDIKAANILLDEDFNAVLGDLGLGIIEEHGTPYVEVAVHGTVGYIAPEYLSMGRCSEKSDVFSYGVFLLQLISGLSAFDLARLANDKDMTLLEWVERIYTENKWELIVDANCTKSDYMEVLVRLLVQISLLCTRYNSESRPKMSEVVRMMEHEDGLAEGWGELLKDKKKKRKRSLEEGSMDNRR